MGYGLRARGIGWCPHPGRIGMGACAWGHCSGRGGRRGEDHRKLLIMMTLLLLLPRVRISCFPSRDQEKSKIRPD